MEQYYSCKLDSLEQLKFFPSDKIRWVKIPDDFVLMQKYYLLFSDYKIAEADFNEGTGRFCALFENGEIISFAGVFYMADRNWELGAVSTHPQYRGNEYATMVSSFIAKHILENDKQVTCNTKADNYPMQRVMQKIGMVMQ